RFALKPSLRIKLDQLSARRAELDALLASEEATRDMERYRSLTRERAEIDPVVERFGEYEKAEADLATAVELAHDPHVRALCGAAALRRRDRLGVAVGPGWISRGDRAHRRQRCVREAEVRIGRA